MLEFVTPVEFQSLLGPLLIALVAGVTATVAYLITRDLLAVRRLRQYQKRQAIAARINRKIYSKHRNDDHEKIL